MGEINMHLSEDYYCNLMDLAVSWQKYYNNKGGRYCPLDVLTIFISPDVDWESNKVRIYNVHARIEILLSDSYDSAVKICKGSKWDHETDKEFCKTLRDWDYEVEGVPGEYSSYLVSPYFCHSDFGDEAVKSYNRICDRLDAINKERYPDAEIKVSRLNEKKGCYIATAVYGSYECPQVCTLRRFRDEHLSNSIFGKLFIKAYYAISPTIVKLFGNTEWFNKFWRKNLDKLVKKLQINGYSNSRYIDKN